MLALPDRASQTNFLTTHAAAINDELINGLKGAADEALRATRLEVRVGLKPQLAELDAEREAIAAAARLAEAEGRMHVVVRQLRALTGME